MTSPKTQVRGPLIEIELQFWRNDESRGLGLGPARTILMLDDALRAAQRAGDGDAKDD
jgi:hypothetical protein